MPSGSSGPPGGGSTSSRMGGGIATTSASLSGLAPDAMPQQEPRLPAAAMARAASGAGLPEREGSWLPPLGVTASPLNSPSLPPEAPRRRRQPGFSSI